MLPPLPPLGTHKAYPPRAPCQKPDWKDLDPSYAPPDFTHQSVVDNDRTKNPKGWADPNLDDSNLSSEWRAKILSRKTNAVERDGKIAVGRDGRPINLRAGRTGIRGRGMLGKWGPNYAADPLVTRFHPVSGELQMVAIERGDMRGTWAIPGGMVEEGEEVSATLKREFTEEAQHNREADPEMTQELISKFNELFDGGGREVFVGYVNDPRNTDNAWMETVCVHFHIKDPVLAKGLKLLGGDDAVSARWLTVSEEFPEFAHLYASHRDMVIKALELDPVAHADALKRVGRGGSASTGAPAPRAASPAKKPKGDL